MGPKQQGVEVGRLLGDNGERERERVWNKGRRFR
jgi:hypothetical protein